MTIAQAPETTRLNGIDTSILNNLLSDVRDDAAKGNTKWDVKTRWVAGGVTETQVDGFELGGKNIPHSFRFKADEPVELGGTNTFPNPQDYLLGAFNACMVVGYVAMATLYGIKLESVEIETTGEIDLRGFLGLSKTAEPGYDELHYTVRIRGNGTIAAFKEIHELVMARSPNRFSLANAIPLHADLIVV